MSTFVSVCILAIIFVVAMLLVGFKTFSAPVRYLTVIASCSAFLAYIHWFFMRMFEHFLTICVLTDSRILALSKTVYTYDLKETAGLGTIQDVKKRQDGIVRNLLRYGNIVVTFSSSSAIMILSNVPNVEFHFRALIRAKEDFLKKRVHKSIISTNQQQPPQFSPPQSPPNSGFSIGEDEKMTTIEQESAYGESYGE